MKVLLTGLFAVAAGLVQAETLEQRLSSVGSHMVMSLALPIDVLQTGLSPEIERQYSGQRSDTIDALSDDKVSWVADATAFQLSANGARLQADLTLQGSVTVEGNLGFLFARETVDVTVDATVVGNVIVRPDWGVALDLDGDARLIDASIDMLGLRINLRSELQSELDRTFSRALTQLERDFAEEVNLRQELRGEWQSVCGVSAISALGMRSVPRDIAIMQPFVFDDVLRLTVVLTTDFVIDNGSRCPAMPDVLTVLE